MVSASDGLQRTRIVQLARECLGTPFLHQGRTINRGMDCAGVLVHVFMGLGMEYRDRAAYPRRPYRGMLEQIMADQPHLKSVYKSELQSGDIVLFRIRVAPQHIGVCAGNTLIHTYYETGRVVEQSIAPWLPSITHVYRIAP